MELATFSDIEFVGIAADRDIAIAPREHGRSDSCSESSSISLKSVSSEIERYDQSLTASAFDIHEVYAIIPSSPSNFVIGLVPDASVTPINNYGQHQNTPSDELCLPKPSSWTGTPGIALPLERYCRDPQRHEYVAVLMALDQPCDIDVPEDVARFKRSPAPSPSTRPGLEEVCHEANADDDTDVVGDATTAQSVADPEEHDYQAVPRPHTLERWSSATMENAKERVVGLQQTGGETPYPGTLPSFKQGLTPALVMNPRSGQVDRKLSTPLSPLSRIEPDTMLEAPNNIDTDETLRAFKNRISKRPSEARAAAQLTLRFQRLRKRKNEEDHPQRRPSRSSPVQSSES